MSKKYVIEIKPEYEDSFKGVMLLGARDSDLYVDTLAVENLEQYIPVDVEKIYDKAFSDGYKRGLEDAWDAAKKIVVDTDHGGFKLDTLREIFGTQGYSYIMQDNTAQEAIDKIKAYEEKQEDDSIKVGDEVRHKNHNTSWTAVVIRREEDVIYLMGHSGAVADYQLSGFEKTGRHFDIQPILEAMRT